MERLTRMIARTVAAASLAFLAFALLACSDLGLRAYVEQKVLEYDLSLDPRPILVLKDGATTIDVNGTVTMPNTIFGVQGLKPLTIENHGNRTLTLLGTPIGMTSSDAGSNYMAQQPGVYSIPAGGAPITFGINYEPTAPDTDYDAVFVINSDDPNHPAYAFSTTGHSTQWHGDQAAVTSGSPSFNYPQIAFLGQTAYLTYRDTNGITLRKSADGGKTWTPTPFWSSSASITTGEAHSTLLTSSGNFHIFYYDNSTTDYARYAKWFTGYTYIDSMWSSAALDYQVWQGIMNASVVVSGTNVYLCYWDNLNSRLRLATSFDSSSPMGFSFSTNDITDGTTHTGGFYPSMKIVGTTVYVSYLDGKTLRLAKASTSNLSSWSYYTVYSDATYNIGAATLVVDSSKGHIIFHTTDDALRHAYSTDGLGLTTWTTDSTLSGESASQSYPLAFIISGSTLYALYNRYYSGSNYGVRLLTSTDSGASWSPQWIDTDLGLSPANISIAVSGSTIYAAYTTGSAHPHGYSVTVKKSLDGGVTW